MLSAFMRFRSPAVLTVRFARALRYVEMELLNWQVLARRAEVIKEFV